MGSAPTITPSDARVFGGPHGFRVWWPAGLENLSPVERAEALKRGWWRDGDHVVTRNGQRFPASDWAGA